MKYLTNRNGDFIGQLTCALPITYRINSIEGVFNHEIGTHYLRKINDKK